MNKASFLLLFLLSVTFSQAQIQGEDEVYLDSDAMEARFQGGGLNVFQEFVFKNLDKTKIEKEIKICTWGMLGEKNIAFELRNSGIPMYVLHDVNIEIEDLTAQIDYIVVTRKLNFIIECKNLIGDIEIDNNGNFLRKYTFKEVKYIL